MPPARHRTAVEVCGSSADESPALFGCRALHRSSARVLLVLVRWARAELEEATGDAGDAEDGEGDSDKKSRSEKKARKVWTTAAAARSAPAQYHRPGCTGARSGGRGSSLQWLR